MRLPSLSVCVVGAASLLNVLFIAPTSATSLAAQFEECASSQTRTEGICDTPFQDCVTGSLDREWPTSDAEFERSEHDSRMATAHINTLTPGALNASHDNGPTTRTRKYTGAKDLTHESTRCSDRLPDSVILGKVAAKRAVSDTAHSLKDKSAASTSHQNSSTPMQDRQAEVGTRYTRNEKGNPEASTDTVTYKLVATSSSDDAQIQDASDWCCVVNKGVKFCFDCPSATSATEISLLPRATGTATMTYGTRNALLHRTDNGNEDSEAVCCFTTGFIVFGCYLCYEAPPEVKMDAAVWKLEVKSEDGQMRYRKAADEKDEFSGEAVDDFERIVCTTDGPEYLVCKPSTATPKKA